MAIPDNCKIVPVPKPKSLVPTPTSGSVPVPTSNPGSVPFQTSTPASVPVPNPITKTIPGSSVKLTPKNIDRIAVPRNTSTINPTTGWSLKTWKKWLFDWMTWRPEFKMEYLMVAGTFATIILLYTNYYRICRIKERRRVQLRKVSMMFNKAQMESEICRDEEEEQNLQHKIHDNRNFLVRIFTFDGLFESREKVDKLLNFIWIPSVPRGLGFWKIRKRKHQKVWHYAELIGSSSSFAPPIPAKEKDKLPANIEYLIRVLYAFSHWTTNQVFELNDTVEYVYLNEGEELIKTDEPDYNIYIILSGQLSITCQNDDGEEQVLKTLHRGDQLCSLLSFLDYILENDPVNGVVQGVALTECEIMKLPMAEIVRVFMPDKFAFSGVVKRLVRRTYGVIFTSCHQVLGLTTELIGSIPRLPMKPLENVQPLQKPSQTIIDDAMEKLMSLLCITDSTLISSCTCIVVPAGFVLFEAGQLRSKEVIFVSEGELEVCMKSGDPNSDDADKPIPFYVNAGEIFGVLSMLTDEARHFRVETSSTSILVVIPVNILTKLMRENPTVLKPMVNSVFSRLSPLARQMDYVIEWTFYESGEAIFQVDDDPVATYLVINGRLRSYIPRRNQMDPSMVHSEYGKYDFVGLPEMWSRRKRTKTVLAVRDTEIAKISFDLLNYLCKRFSKVSLQILQFLTRRVTRNYKTAADDGTEQKYSESYLSHTTYAVFPTSPEVPVAYLAKEFTVQYEKYGTIIKVDSAFVKKQFGYTENDETIDAGTISGLTPWLAYLESTYSKILYVADHVVNLWSRKCFHEADVIFIAVPSDGNKEISPIENMILSTNSLAQKELWICHKFQEGFPLKAPRYTKLWLENRRWLTFHHQLYVNSRYYGLTVEQVDKLGPEHFEKNADMGRIVRWLTGNSFGVALGGGGAKGAAHIGFFREFSKIRLPIDMICGVSIGSLIGALLALFQDIDKTEAITRQFFDKLVHSQRFLLDLTIPFVSMFQGEAINHSLIEIFGDTQIEDMRIPYFTCTTDLTNNSIREHRCGSLWRFVRASMTLITYFPPVCDPRDGHYLIDGGYTNLVPADIMKRIGIKYILALDISSKPNMNRFTDYGDSISGFVLLSHFTPVPEPDPVTAPSMSEIQTRLNWAQSVVYLDLVKKLEQLQATDNAPSVVYLRLPIDFYTTGDFNRFDNMRNIGHEFAARLLDHVKLEDPIDVIWTKLKSNRGAQRLSNSTTSNENMTTLASTSFDGALDVTSDVDLNDTSLSLYGSHLKKTH